MEGSTFCAPRFSSFSEEEKAALIEKVTPQSTKSATKFWVRVVCDFAREKGISFDFATIEEGQLARLLEDFYCSLRKKDGTEYKRSSYLAARGAVQRELNRLERNINIQSPAFTRANKLLDATLKEKKREGREPAVTHKDNISDLDWQQLRSYFSDVLTTLDIKKLAYYVWFNTTLHFCLRGNEAQSKLKKTDLLFTTIEGERAIVLNADFLSKNHQGGVAGSSSETKGAITKPEMVAAFERYISKLHPQLDRLFQRAKYGECVLKVDSPVWFKTPTSLTLNTFPKKKEVFYSLERFFIRNKKPLSEVIIQNKNRFLCGASKWRFLSASFNQEYMYTRLPSPTEDIDWSANRHVVCGTYMYTYGCEASHFFWMRGRGLEPNLTDYVWKRITSLW